MKWEKNPEKFIHRNFCLPPFTDKSKFIDQG